MPEDSIMPARKSAADFQPVFDELKKSILKRLTRAGYQRFKQEGWV